MAGIRMSPGSDRLDPLNNYRIPLVYREQATFHTDQYDAYTGVIPAGRHRAITKRARKTNHIERFNNTLRQRLSRLVRETLSFSKKLAHHIGAIKYGSNRNGMKLRGKLRVRKGLT